MTSIKEPILAEIKPSNYPSASQLLADCFFDNPAHIYFCRKETTRKAELAWLLGLNLKLQMAHEAESFCISDNNMTKAMGFWTKPNQTKVGLLQKMSGGLVKVPFKMGMSAFFNVMEVSAGIEQHLHQTMGKMTHYRYLNNMVIQPELQGKGLGTKILQKEFDRIQAEENNAILALSTQRYWTVKFYERLGFEVLLEEKIGKDDFAFTNWTMRKDLVA